MKVLKFPKGNRDKLIEDHMHLVPVIARSIQAKVPASFEFDDLCSEGYVGLIKAADGWDPTRGPFEPRARYVVMMTILNSVRRKKYTDNTHVSLDSPREDTTLLHFLDEKASAKRVPLEEENDRVTSIDMGRKKKVLRGAIQQIASPRARRVVEIFYLEKGNMTKAAKELKVQSSRASQIHQDGLRELSNVLTMRGVPVPYEQLRSKPCKVA